jgi:hypothetical protein
MLMWFHCCCCSSHEVEIRLSALDAADSTCSEILAALVYTSPLQVLVASDSKEKE